MRQERGKNQLRKWDMMIAHLPCTYFAVSGAKWYYHLKIHFNLKVEARRPISSP